MKGLRIIEKKGAKMNITTGYKDKRAFAEVSYKPSQYLLEFDKEYDFKKQVENGTSEYEYMSKILAIFIDMLEVVIMDYGYSVVGFGETLEGLIKGFASQLALSYGVEYDNQIPIQELLEALKQEIRFEKEDVDISKKRASARERLGIKGKKDNVVFLKKPFE
jgi:hypothetical protein